MAADTPRQAAESTYAATGIAGLDAVLGGGVARRHLYVIEGPPGTGKTTLALHFLLAGRMFPAVTNGAERPAACRFAQSMDLL
jgi:predicted ATP-dependent serine protease